MVQVKSGFAGWTLRGGRVICPATETDAVLDIRIDDGVITAMEPPGVIPYEASDIDVSGLIVTPGLIDFHVHTAQAMSCYGVCADRNGIASGVCHVNDMAGVGWLAPNVMREYTKEVITPMTATIYSAGCGNPENWAIGCPDVCAASTDEKLLEGAIRANPDLFTSIKVHCDIGFLSCYGDEPLRGYHTARRVARRLDIPLYLHLGLFTQHDGHLSEIFDSLMAEIVDTLAPGDVIGHVLSYKPGTIFEKDVDHWTKLLAHDDLHWEVGHGANLCFDMAKEWKKNGKPLLISTDAHMMKPHLGMVDSQATLPHQRGPLQRLTLVGTMSKLRNVGYSLTEVIRGASEIPARALRIDDKMGRLSVGRPATITVMEDRAGHFVYADSRGAKLPATQALLPRMSVVAGRAWRLFPEKLIEFEAELNGGKPLSRGDASAKLANQGLESFDDEDELTAIEETPDEQNRRSASAM